MQAENTPKPDEPVVYVIQAEHGGPVKIGYSARADGVRGRLAALQTGNPYTLVVRQVIPAPNRTFDECELHERYARFRLVGEWFMDCTELCMELRIPLPGSHDEARRLRPVIDSSYDVGLKDGLRRGEVLKQKQFREFFESAIRWFDDETTEIPGETDGMEFALRQLRKYLRPNTTPHTPREKAA